MVPLTLKEEIILGAIALCGGESGGAPIRKKVIELTRKEIVYGTLYNLMDKLIQKGLVTTGTIEPTPVQGGRSKTLYAITPLGREALSETLELHASLRAQLSDLR